MPCLQGQSVQSTANGHGQPWTFTSALAVLGLWLGASAGDSGKTEASVHRGTSQDTEQRAGACSRPRSSSWSPGTLRSGASPRLMWIYELKSHCTVTVGPVPQRCLPPTNPTSCRGKKWPKASNSHFFKESIHRGRQSHSKVGRADLRTPRVL